VGWIAGDVRKLITVTRRRDSTGSAIFTHLHSTPTPKLPYTLHKLKLDLSAIDFPFILRRGTIMAEQLESLHLEGLPRRDEFRSARRILHENCGEQTILGNAADFRLEDFNPANGDTLPGPAAANCIYFVDDGTTQHQLTFGINSIGRLQDNDVVIRDDHVSRRHCAIVIHQTGIAQIHDVASKNGTIVNGSKIPVPTILRHGDTIMLCTRKLRFIVVSVKDPLDGLL